MSFWSKLAGLLGIREDQVEDALKSEKAAFESLSRRSFFGVSAAIVAGTAFSFGNADAPPPPRMNAFLEAKMREIDALYAQAAESLSLHMWGNQGSAIGRIATLSNMDFSL